LGRGAGRRLMLVVAEGRSCTWRRPQPSAPEPKIGQAAIDGLLGLTTSTIRGQETLVDRGGKCDRGQGRLFEANGNPVGDRPSGAGTTPRRGGGSLEDLGQSDRDAGYQASMSAIGFFDWIGSDEPDAGCKRGSRASRRSTGSGSGDNCGKHAWRPHRQGATDQRTGTIGRKNRGAL